MFGTLLVGLLLAGAASAQQPAEAALGAPSIAEVLAHAQSEEWRRPQPGNLIVFEFAAGDVIVELAPAFAPKHHERLLQLVRAGAFDGSSVLRSQDNYVAQWSTRSADEDGAIKAELTTNLPAEFERSAEGVPFVGTQAADPYAPEAGFAVGQPVARDPEGNALWMVHCYGVVGVARDQDPDSGNGTQLYAVTGHAPRHLDRNMTMVGRVISGMPHLTTLSRGSGGLGFYEDDEEKPALRRAVVASDLPETEQPRIELLRTNSPSFTAYVAARSARSEAFFVHRAGGIDVCNVPIPSRVPPE